MIALLFREFKINLRNFSEILSIILFFLLSVLIFVFSVGTDKIIFEQIGIGIVWALLLLSNTLALRKFFQNDFDDNSIIIFHISGLSYEIIVLIKIISIWLCIQIPFLFIIPMPAFLFGIGYLIYSMYSMKSNKSNIGHEAHIGGAIGGFFTTIILCDGHHLL